MTANATTTRRARTTGTRETSQVTRPRTGGRARLIDVARKAGVHSNTVSAVLNNRDYCYASELTRRRILDAARKLNYRPSALARGLSGQRTATLGMVATGYDSELVTRIMYGFDQAARRHGQFMLTAATYNTPELEDQAILQMTDRAVDGIAIWPCTGGEHKELRRLVERGFPVVAFSSTASLGFDIDRVYDDPVEAGRLQARHLIECGRRKIWLTTFSERCAVNDRKIEGFEQAMAEAGLAARHFVVHDPKFALYSQDVAEFEQFRELFGRHRGEIDALACPGDIVAQAAIRFAIESGLRVPEDVAVIGNGAMSSSTSGALPLSTTWFDAERVGCEAFNLLAQRLDGQGEAKTCRRIVVKPELVARASTVAVTPGRS